MLAIRLQRIGKKNRPSYRVVVSEKKRDLYGKHNEILGNYDPLSKPKTINLKTDRIKYWISVGAKPSATVHNLLVSNKVIDAKKVSAWTPKKKQGKAGEKNSAQAKETTAEKKEEPKLEQAPAEDKPAEVPKPDEESTPEKAE